MAKNKRNDDREPGDWRHLAASGVLLVAVFGTLLSGAVLQVQRDDRGSAPVLGTPLGDPAFPAPAESDPLPSDGPGSTAAEPGMVVPFDGDGDLVDRATYDERRLQASGSGYTLQFAVNCEAKNVRSNLEALESYPNFYLLTMLYQDRACFRLCWGFYDNERQARSERNVPEALRRMTDAPKVISVAEALP